MMAESIGFVLQNGVILKKLIMCMQIFTTFIFMTMIGGLAATEEFFIRTHKATLLIVNNLELQEQISGDLEWENGKVMK